MKVLPANDENIEKAAVVIRKGGIVVYPTETVYGIGCAPENPDAAERVCYIKGRADKPLPLACSDTDEAQRIVEFNPAAERLAERFWIWRPPKWRPIRWIWKSKMERFFTKKCRRRK